MKNYEVHIKVFKTAGHIKTLLFLYFLILQFKLSISGICNPDIYLSDSSCFNNIIKYNDIRAGHFATKKNVFYNKQKNCKDNICILRKL